MSFNCPHCGKVLDIVKKDVSKSVSVGKPKVDLEESFSDSLEKAIDNKVRPVEKMSGIDQLNRMVSGSFSPQNSGLCDGYGNSLTNLMKERENLMSNGVSVGGDSEAGDITDNEVLAKRLQNLIHGSLSK